MREIVLDTETTGLDPVPGPPPGRDRLRRAAQPHSDRRDVPRLSQSGTRHAGGSVRGARPVVRVPQGQAAASSISSTSSSPSSATRRWSIHNASFDLGFLCAELKRVERALIARERLIDTLMLARRKHSAGPYSLDALCARYGIDNSRRTKHGALLDAEILAEVYVELIGARQAQLGLAETIARGNDGRAGAIVLRERPQPLPPRITRGGPRRASRLRRHAGRERALAEYSGAASG